MLWGMCKGLERQTIVYTHAYSGGPSWTVLIKHRSVFLRWSRVFVHQQIYQNSIGKWKPRQWWWRRGFVSYLYLFSMMKNIIITVKPEQVVIIEVIIAWFSRPRIASGDSTWSLTWFSSLTSQTVLPLSLVNLLALTNESLDPYCRHYLTKAPSYLRHIPQRTWTQTKRIGHARLTMPNQYGTMF